MRPLPVLCALVVGCQSSSTPTPASRADAVTVRDSSGERTLARTAAGCRLDDVVITVAGAEARSGTWRLAPGPTGLALTEADALVARLADEPGPPQRRIYLDPVGVPLARVTVDADAATVVGADRSPLGELRAGADGVRYLGADGATAAVTGTTDLALAAALVAPSSLPPLARAVVACARLVAVTPTPGNES